MTHGFTKLSTTITVNGYCYRYVINDHHSPPLAMSFQCVYRYVAQTHHIQYLTYSISSLNYCFYLLIHIRLLLLLLILPTKNNKSVKAPFTRDVQKNTVLRCGLMQIQHLASPRAVFVTRPHPSYCIFHTSLAMVL